MAEVDFAFETTRQPMSGKRERLTVSTTVVPITASVYTVERSAGATKDGLPDRLASAAVLQVFGDVVIYTLDGTTPASGTGFEAAVGDIIRLDSTQKIKSFKAIRKTTDATIEVLPLFGA